MRLATKDNRILQCDSSSPASVDTHQLLGHSDNVESAFSTSIAIEIDPGDDAPMRNYVYRVLLPGHSMEQTKVYMGERKLKGTIY